MHAKGGHPPDISACSFNSPCKSLQLVFSLERCQAGDSPSVRRAVKSSWRSKFVRNLFLLKSVSFIKKKKKTKAEKQKQKTRNSRGRGRPGPRRHFTTCEVTTLPYMAPCLPAAANQRAVPSHVTCHEGSTAISLFRKSLASSAESFASRLHAKCACRMCLVDWHLSTRLFQQVKSLRALELRAFFM